MKKLNIVVMSILTILLSSVLAACSFKKVEANFTQSEVVLSVGQTFDLGELVEVSGTDPDKISYMFSNSSMFEVEGSVITPTLSGKSVAYAAYNKNILSSMRVVVKKPFGAPTGFVLSGNVLNWDAVAGTFEDDLQPTLASSYQLVGKRITYNSNGEEVANDVSFTTTTTSYTLTEAGKYTLSVRALGGGYFEDGMPTAQQTFFVGFMPQIESGDFSWGNGVLSWTMPEDVAAKFSLTFDGVELAQLQQENSFNLNTIFESASAGAHKVCVTTYDVAEENQKLPMKSEEIVITKLAAPSLSDFVFENGKIAFPKASQADSFVVEFESKLQNKQSFVVESGKSSSFDGLGEGAYEASVRATNKQGFFFQSDATSLGFVYKLATPTLQGAGVNTLNGSSLSAAVKTSSLGFATTLYVSDEAGKVQDFEIDPLAIHTEILLGMENAGRQNFSAWLLSKQKHISVGDGENLEQAFVLASATRQQALTAVKVDAFETAITHKYENNRSVFLFEKVAHADSFEVRMKNGGEYVSVATDYSIHFEEASNEIKIVFNDKVDNLYPISELSFQIVANSDEAVQIGSATLKNLSKMANPLPKDTLQDGAFAWEAGCQMKDDEIGTDRFAYEVYAVDKAEFAKDLSDIQLPENKVDEGETSGRTLVIDNVGYYVVRLRAISGHEDEYLSAGEWTSAKVLISSQLTLNENKMIFGFDPSKVNEEGQTDASGYFLDLVFSSNVQRFEVSTNNNTYTVLRPNDMGTKSLAFTEKFDAGTQNITIVGYGADDAIYLPTQAYQFSVTKLASVDYDDLTINDFMPNQWVSVSKSTESGVRNIIISSSDGKTVSSPQSAKMEIGWPRFNNFDLNFKLEGTLAVNNQYIISRKQIFLDSEISTISFSRMVAPTGLSYEDGRLKFRHSEVGNMGDADFYVVDLLCKSVAGEDMHFGVRFANTVTAVYEDTTVELDGTKRDYVSVGTESGSYNDVSIDIGKVIDFLKSNKNLLQFNQAKTVDFSVYSYQRKTQAKPAGDGTLVLLSSGYATTLGSDETSLSVKKLDAVEIEYDEALGKLVWQFDKTDISFAAQTSFEVFATDASGNTNTQTTTEAGVLVESGKTYQVVVKNPHYISSNASNTVKIKQLSKLMQVALTENAELTFQIEDVGHCQSVLVSYNGTESEVQLSQHGTAKVVIAGEGEYSFKLLGTQETLDDITTYYTASDTSKWTTSKLSSLASGVNLDVALANNQLSWNALDPTGALGSLEYYVIFTDEGGNVVAHLCNKNTALDWANDAKVIEALKGLEAGTISAQVVAHAKPDFGIGVNGVVYYSEAMQIMGENKFNFFNYNNIEVQKLATPSFEEVKFVVAAAEQFSQTPEIEVSISGNFGAKATFNIYRAGQFLFARELERTTENVYKLLLTAEDYNNALSAGTKTLMFDIAVVRIGENENTIPSTFGSIMLLRAGDLQDLNFVQDELGFMQKIEVTHNNPSQELLGGIVIKLEFVDDNGQSQVVFKKATDSLLEVTDIIANSLSGGGEIVVSAFVNSFASKDVLICASAGKVEKTFSVLKQVTSAEIVKKDYGFEIVDTNEGVDVSYVVSYLGEKVFVSKDADGEFKFVTPNDWADAIYNLSIYAAAENFVASKQNEIAYTLARLESVKNIALSRESNILGEISWDAVDGAEGYIIHIKNKADGALLHTFEGTENSYSLLEIFGENYENITGEGKLSAENLFGNTDCHIVLEVIAKGGVSESGEVNKNNSQATKVFATIKANSIVANSERCDIAMDEFGNITFERQPAQNYLYRFVAGDGTELLASDGTSMSVWKSLTENFLDTSALKLDGLPFNVEILLQGSLKAGAADSQFELDSAIFSTTGMAETYFKLDDIQTINLDASAEGGLTITLAYDSFSNLFVGFDENDIKTGNVVKIVPDFFGAHGDMFDYTFPLAELLNKISQQQVSAGKATLHFWAYQQSEAPIGYVSSNAYKFDLILQTDPGFVDVIKGEYESASTAALISDFINTFVTFKNEDTLTNKTIGIFVKIETEDGFSYTTFKTLKELEAYPELFNNFAINLTELFENNEELSALSGSISVDFARASYAFSDDGLSYVLSDWLSKSTGALVFDRLEAAATVGLSNGNLNWTGSGEKATKYYVYFYSNIEAKDYAFMTTTYTNLNLSEFGGKNPYYYVAVQAINETDKFVLSSGKVFKTSEGAPQQIYKNQINSPLKLENGKMFIDWKKTSAEDESNLYSLLTSAGDFATISQTLATKTFTIPFTMSLNDLVSENIFVRMRFTQLSDDAVGKSKTYDISALQLLANLVQFAKEDDDFAGGFNLLERLDALSNVEENLAYRSLIERFKEAIQKSSYGVANEKSLFDKNFESLQMGAYALDYCLVTKSSTMNSAWYSFSNGTENKVYVNGEPSVSAKVISSSTVKAWNEFKVVIKKTEVTDFMDGQYVQVQAQNYVMVLGQNAYSIYKSGSGFKMKTLTEENTKTLSVFECDANGNQMQNGNFLMFYLNYNNGDSFQGVFDNKVKGAQEMQIYARGTNYSFSSKSRYFNVTFLSFESFGVSDGTFVWTTYQNMTTTVLVQGSRSTEFEDPIPVEEDKETASARFSLDGWDYGTYTLQFVIEGAKSTKANVIVVDSEIYRVENVFKLDAPQLSNSKGYIGLDVTNETRSQLSRTYTDNDQLYSYSIYNDYSGSSKSKNFSDERLDKTSTLFYEVGTTGVANDDAEFEYKSTEELANSFNIVMIGSSATLSAEADSTKYYLKHIKCLDKNQAIASGSIALRSEYSTLSASMLDVVQNVRVENGVVMWDAVTGRGDMTVEEGASIAYKVTFTKYVRSYDENGFSETDELEPVVDYTTSTSYDMTKLQETGADGDNHFLRVTVQALAVFVTDTNTTGQDIEFVENTFGSGHAKFAGSDMFVLMGNGGVLKDIDRLKPVEELAIEDGKLTWKYTNSTVDVDNFRDYFDFIVTDDEGKVIEGDYTISGQDGIFSIVFTERKGQMKEGTYDISVYATQGSRNTSVAIKSFARTLTITKLEKLTSEDFVINSNIENDFEILSLQSYFAGNQFNLVEATINVNGSVKNFTFTTQKYKLYILKNQLADGQTLDYSDGFVTDSEGNGFIVIGSNTAYIRFKAVRTGVIGGDESENFVLHRTNWKDSTITFNATAQEFTWNYDLYSFNASVTAQKMRRADVLKALTVLYTNATLTTSSGTSAPAGSEIVVLDASGSKAARILYNGAEFYVAKDSFESRFVQMLDAENQPLLEDLQSDNLFTILQKDDNLWIIEIDGQYYQVNSQFVESPVFIVEATYEKTGGATEKRIYTTTDKVFRPTLLGQVFISVRIKINNINLLSEANTCAGAFSLFQEGDGTSISPYTITTPVQFKNLAYRMKKDEMLLKYTAQSVIAGEVSGSVSVTDTETSFYFSIQTDLNLGEFEGVLLGGEFGGVIDGGGHSISYTSTGVGQLSRPVTVHEDETVLYLQQNVKTLNYAYGTALFEQLGSSANVANLNLQATYGNSSFVVIEYHSLVAGLAISNSGVIGNITVGKFENHFYGDLYPDKVAMSYSGIVAINNGTAEVFGCNVNCNINISDNGGLQLISLGGIAYMNFGKISNSTSGQSGQTLSVSSRNSINGIQVAGVVVTNCTTGNISDCTNNFAVSAFAGQSGNSITCYLAGVAVLGRGSVDAVNNGGTPLATNIASATIGDVIARLS